MLLSGAACVGMQDRSPAPFEALGWPANDPRVRLERVICPRHEPGGSGARWLRRLAGKTAPDLFRRPFGVAWQGDSLLVADPDAGRVAGIADSGRVVISAGGLFERPMGVAACSLGIVVSDAATGKVGLLGENLRLVGWLAEGLVRPTGVACSGDRVFVAETGKHRIAVLQSDGSQLFIGHRGAGPGEFNFPTSVVVDEGSLWVGDTLNFRVQRYDLQSGTFIAAFGQTGDAAGEMPRIKGLAVDKAGHLWVSDGLLDRVSLYTREGTFLVAIGARGLAPGYFSFPSGIAAHPDGRVAVADSLNRRVQIFRHVDRPPSPDPPQEQP